MKIKKHLVTRLNGEVINIGPWDEQRHVVQRNPLPDGAVNRPEPVPVMEGGKPKMIRLPATPGIPAKYERVEIDGEVMDRLVKEEVPGLPERDVPALEAGPPRWFVGDKLIHEGEWDFQPEEVVGNPMPEGAVAAEESVIEEDDGSKRIPPPQKTYAELRAEAYPPLADQLDAMWKGGKPAEDMAKTIAQVKAAHPKPVIRQARNAKKRPPK